MTFALLVGVLVALMAAPPRDVVMREAGDLVRSADQLTLKNGPRYPWAAGPLSRALDLYEKAGAPRETADTLRRLMRIDRAVARRRAEELAALDRSLGAPPEILAEDELFVTRHFYEQRRFDLAFAHLRETKRLASAGRSRPLLAAAHTLGATMRNFRGEADRAIAEWREADRLHGLAGDLLQQAHARSNLGTWLFEIGRYGEALQVLTSAIALAERAERGARYRDELLLNREAMAESLGALAEINRRFGHLDEALALFDRARVKFRWALSPGRGYMHLVDMADIYSEQGRNREAERLYELVLADSPADPRRTEAFQPLRVRIGYAGHLLRTGRPAAARELLNEGLEIALRHHCYGLGVECVLELGETEIVAGHHDAAEQWFDRALELARTHVPSSEVLWRAHYGKGQVLAAKRGFDQAAAEYRHAVDAIDKSLREIPETAESPATMRTPVWSPYHALMIEELRRGSTESALRLAERAKMALVTLALPKSDPPEVLSPAELREDERFRETLGTFRHLAFDGSDAALSNTRFIRLQNDYALFRQELARKHPELLTDRAALEPIGAAHAVRVAQQSGAMILAYELAGERAFVFVIDGNGVEAVELEAGAARIRNLAVEIAAAERDPFWASRSPSHMPVARALYRALLPPRVEARLARARAVAVIPDAELWLVPFEMLWRTDGARREYLVERFPISYAPSITVLRDLMARSERARAGRRGAPLRVAALMDPEIATAGQDDPLRGHFSARPAAEEKVRLVRQFGARAVVLERSNATPAAARRALRDADIVHFGCHGLYNEKYPLYSALLLSKGGGSADGFLEARDIAATRIRAQLVAFGACESGRGEIARGQGLVGMTWAALRGGAASAVAMRWRVDDHATARLFASFYGNLDRGERQTDALRHAQLELIRSADFSNPYYWAGVTLIGCERAR